MDLPRIKGSYILLVRTNKRITLRIGRLGNLTINPGLYAYVGSAWGPGGLKARICRHLRKTKKIFWHIDYLTSQGNIELIIIFPKQKIESTLAQKLMKSFKGIPRFGASDTRDYSHLFFVHKPADIIDFLRKLGYEFTLVKPNAKCLCTYVPLPPEKTNRNMQKT